jgi:thioredoxin 1
MSDLQYVDDSNFETEVLKSKVPVLVDFSATWCGPCQRQLPILEKFALANANKIKVVKVDIDEAPQITSKLGIRGVPSMVLFNQGERVDMRVGLTSLADLDHFVTTKVGA